jgi:hypothetical protein
VPDRRSLDWLNFLLADLRGGLRPASGLLGIAFHAAIGALIDVTRAKRALLIGGAWSLERSVRGKLGEFE